MKFLTLAFVLLVSLNTLVRADDVVGKIFEDKKNGVQLQLKCLSYDENHQCVETQYALVAGGRVRMIGPVLEDEIFEFFSDEIREHLDKQKLKSIEDKEYVDIPDFLPSGTATEWYAYNGGYELATILTIFGGGFGSCFMAVAGAGPVGWAIFGGVFVMAYATPTLIDLVVLSTKGVALGVTSVAVGTANVGIAIRNGINRLKTKGVFKKLGKAMNGNPEVEAISHRKFNRLVESIEALNF